MNKFGFATVVASGLTAAILGLACLAGINLYLTVFVTGLAIHFHWITLAPQYQSLEALGNPWIISIAGVLYFLQFFADKIPWLDSAWDAVHTFIRPIGGALLAGPMTSGVSDFTRKFMGVPVRVSASPSTVLFGAVLGALVGVAAAWIPARRATRMRSAR